MYSFTNYLVMYDIADSRRASKILIILRGYLFHIQHSVFEGKLTKSQFHSLKEQLEKIVIESDSIIIYPLSYLNILNKITIGKSKFKISPIF